MIQGQYKFKENQDKIETWPERGICSVTQLASVIQPIVTKRPQIDGLAERPQIAALPQGLS
jgi:hypothetical protein